jgi:hypothetical protein
MLLAGIMWRWNSAPTINGVLGVVLVRSNVQVIRVHAKWHVASMPDDEAFWYFALEGDVCHAVRLRCPASPPHVYLAVIVPGTKP